MRVENAKPYHWSFPAFLSLWIERKEHPPGWESVYQIPWVTHVSAAGYQVCHHARLPLSSSVVSGSNRLTVSRPFCHAYVGWSKNSLVSTSHSPILSLMPIWGVTDEFEKLTSFVTQFLAVSAPGSVRHLSLWSRCSECRGFNNWLWFHAPREALLSLLP